MEAPLSRLHLLPPYPPPQWAEGSVYQQQIKLASIGTMHLLKVKASLFKIKGQVSTSRYGVNPEQKVKCFMLILTLL